MYISEFVTRAKRFTSNISDPRVFGSSPFHWLKENASSEEVKGEEGSWLKLTVIQVQQDNVDEFARPVFSSWVYGEVKTVDRLSQVWGNRANSHLMAATETPNELLPWKNLLFGKPEATSKRQIYTLHFGFKQHLQSVLGSEKTVTFSYANYELGEQSTLLIFKFGAQTPYPDNTSFPRRPSVQSSEYTVSPMEIASESFVQPVKRFLRESRSQEAWRVTLERSWLTMVGQPFYVFMKMLGDDKPPLPLQVDVLGKEYGKSIRLRFRYTTSQAGAREHFRASVPKSGSDFLFWFLDNAHYVDTYGNSVVLQCEITIQSNQIRTYYDYVFSDSVSAAKQTRSQVYDREDGTYLDFMIDMKELAFAPEFDKSLLGASESQFLSVRYAGERSDLLAVKWQDNVLAYFQQFSLGNEILETFWSRMPDGVDYFHSGLHSLVTDGLKASIQTSVALTPTIHPTLNPSPSPSPSLSCYGSSLSLEDVIGASHEVYNLSLSEDNLFTETVDYSALHRDRKTRFITPQNQPDIQYGECMSKTANAAIVPLVNLKHASRGTMKP